MLVKFVMEDQLDRAYVAFGRFYKIKYKNMKPKECRSVLEVYSRNNYNDFKGTNKIDAVFVMMNPGSGKPKTSYTQKVINLREIKKGTLEEIQLVEADPDDTQYQVMRVMKEKEWNYVRVINLSDFKDADSKAFYDEIKKAQTYDNDYIHSIFSQCRAGELKSIFKSAVDYKIVSAWGVHTKLCNLIELALDNTNLISRIGNNKATYKKKKFFYYYHPLQRGQSRQEKWLEELINKL